MSQSCNEDKFWCLLQLSWEMRTHGPKSHRGRGNRTDLLCLSGPHGHQINGQCHGTPLWTDLQFFLLLPRPQDVTVPHPEWLISNRRKWGGGTSRFKTSYRRRFRGGNILRALDGEGEVRSGLPGEPGHYTFRSETHSLPL